MSAVELKPCPFCGGAGDIESQPSYSQAANTYERHRGWCDRCGFGLDWHNHESDAIAAWNARPTPALDEAGARRDLIALAEDLHGAAARLHIRGSECRPLMQQAAGVLLTLAAARALAERPRDTTPAVESGSADRDTQGAQRPAAEVEAEAIERCARIADVLADEKDILALSADESNFAAYREGERTAQQIAAAIRSQIGAGDRV